MTLNVAVNQAESSLPCFNNVFASIASYKSLQKIVVLCILSISII